MNLVKPFLNKETAEKVLWQKHEILLTNVLQVIIHQSFDSLTKDIPLECLPEDYGGSEQSIAELHGKVTYIYEHAVKIRSCYSEN